MKPKHASISLSVLLAFLLSACSAPPSDPSATGSAEQEINGVGTGPTPATPAASWHAILRCDGNTVVDVNTSERRNLQLVIREPSVIDRLLSSGFIDHYVGQTADNLEVILGGDVASHWANIGGGLINVQDDWTTGAGVFVPGDFHGFIGTRQEQNYYHAAGIVAAEIQRNSAANALDVSFRAARSKCVKYGPTVTDCASSESGFCFTNTPCLESFSWTEELANWRFNGCQEL